MIALLISSLKEANLTKMGTNQSQKNQYRKQYYLNLRYVQLKYIYQMIKGRIPIILVILLLAKATSCLSNADLFFLSDAQLFQMGVDIFRNGSDHNQLGRCIINNDPHACSNYAQVCYPDGTCKGLPDLIGSGCLDGCWGPPNTYYNYQSSKVPICTGDVITNGANMLRIGLIKGYCGRSNDSSLKNLVQNSNLFFLSDAQLFQMGIFQFHNGTFHNQLGGCGISDDPHACSHYAFACKIDGTCTGLPDLYGSGCLDGCWGPPNTYYNYQSSKIPICTGDVTVNGANMMRIGLIKGYCGSSNISSNSTASNNTSSNVNSSTTNVSSSVNSTANATFNSSASSTNSSYNGNLSTMNTTSNVNSTTNATSPKENSAIANASSDQINPAKTVTQSSTVQRLPLEQLWIGWAVIVGLMVIIIILLICLLFRLTGSGRLYERSIEEDSKTAPTIVNISS